jgi:hypothetical protein
MPFRYIAQYFSLIFCYYGYSIIKSFFQVFVIGPLIISDAFKYTTCPDERFLLKNREASYLPAILVNTNGDTACVWF